MAESFFHDHSTEVPGETPPVDGQSTQEQLRQALRSDSSEDDARIAAVMAYVPFLCFIPLLNMRDNKEAQFHARQGVVLFLLELLAGLFLIDGIADFVFKAVLVAAVAFSVAGVYFALQGKKFRLPVIGDLADKTKL